jgi:hypothetical protein
MLFPEPLFLGVKTVPGTVRLPGSLFLESTMGVTLPGTLLLLEAREFLELSRRPLLGKVVCCLWRRLFPAEIKGPIKEVCVVCGSMRQRFALDEEAKK